MRRSRSLVLFGGFLIVTALGTVSAHSHAAGRGGRQDVSLIPLGASDGGANAPELARGAGGLLKLHRDLLPPLARRGGAEPFGSFVRPSSPGGVWLGDEACPPEMVSVEGDYCPVVAQRCLRWLDSQTKLQCAEFEHLASGEVCPVKVQHKRFCVDRYEWPNRAGALPQYMTSWSEAKSSCEGAGKRLCSDTEWTVACEGPDQRPYPYGDGYVRDDRACNIDKPYIWPRAERIFDAKTRDDELARLDQREPSGSRTACVSPYGVSDMVGNVDEWVNNESQFGKPYRSGLKGGYWGPVRTRCRPMTTAHDENFRYYQIGFRCCREARAVDVAAMPIAQVSPR